MTAKRYTDEAQLPVYEALKSMPKIIDKPAHTAIIKRKYRTTATLRHTGTGVNAVGGGWRRGGRNKESGLLRGVAVDFALRQRLL